MTDLSAVPPGGEIERFDPERHRLNIAALNYGIEEAKRIKDWSALETAVDAKIEEQKKFVRWWQSTVSIGESKRASRVPGSLSLAKAEALTGMAHQRYPTLPSDWLILIDIAIDCLVLSIVLRFLKRTKTSSPIPVMMNGTRRQNTSSGYVVCLAGSILIQLVTRKLNGSSRRRDSSPRLTML